MDSDRVEPERTADTRLYLAAPWQRLAAAATDVCLLLILYTICFVVFLSYDALPDDRILNGGAACCGWLYLLLNWAWGGATPGQRMWRIRVVSLDGSPITFTQALRRCLGYAVSILPLKPGLWPILWHPLRQGWHDRFAGTIVVRCSVQTATIANLGSSKYSTKNDEVDSSSPTLPIPQLKYPWHYCGWVLLSYIVLALSMTYPLVTHFTTYRAGVAGDANQFLWNDWFVARALSHGESPLQTKLLFYPETVSLTFHTMNWFHCLLAVPLQQFFSLTVTYNLLFLGTLVACAFCSYWLLCSLTQDRLASAIVAPAFGFSPYFMTHALGHMNLISAQFIPLFGLFFYAALVDTRARQQYIYAALAGACLSLAGYCDWYYFIFCLTLGGGLFAGVVAQSGGRKRWLSCSLLTFITLIVAVLLLCPLLIATLRERARGSYMNLPASIIERFQADLLNYLSPSPLHPQLGIPHYIDRIAIFGVENVLSPGYMVLLLAAVGLYFSARRLYPWLLSALIGLVFSAGFVLTIAYHSSFNQFAMLALSGAPGCGFDLPWETHGLVALAQRLAGDPAALLRNQASITLPFTWLPLLLPPLKAFKVTARFGVLVLLGCSLFATVGLSHLRLRCKELFGTTRSTLLIVGAALIILWEYWAMPYPIASTAVPPFYHQLARQPEFFAVVEVPLRSGISSYQYYQTVHHKPIFAGSLSREPTYADRFIEGNALLCCFDTAPADMAAFAAQLSAARLKAALSQLRAVQAGYIILHKDSLDGDQLRGLGYLLHNRCHLKQSYDDAALRAYRVTLAPIGSPLPALQ